MNWQQWRQDWLPTKADLPDAFRISIPMIVVLLLFGSQGLLAAGVSGLITAWLVGVQGRSLCYVKRAWFLGISTLLCLLANGIAVVMLYSPLWAAINLCLFALLYGLTSNQRSHIRMFTYNFGFSLIIAMHFLAVGQPLHVILWSTLIGGGAAWIASLAFWPFSEGRIGVQLLQQTRATLVSWMRRLVELNQQPYQFLENPPRYRFDEAVSRLIYWLRSTSAKKCASQLRVTLLRFLRLSEELARLGRFLQADMKNNTDVLGWLSASAEALEQGKNLPLFDGQASFEVQTLIDRLIADYNREEVQSQWSMEDISRIWPRDRVAFLRDLKSAFSWQSREWHHGLRIALTLAVTQFIAYYYQIPQGYWITLTAFIVLLTSPIGVTSSRIRYRFYGTVLGAPIAFLLIFIAPTGFLLALTCLFTFIAFATAYKPRYEVHVLWITVMIVFAIAILTPNDIYIAVYRLVDTLIGVGIAYLANFLVFPAWTRRWLDQHALCVVTTQMALLKSVCESPDSFHLRHWQSVQAFRVLNQELLYLTVEPNTNPRDIKDWQAFAILCRRIHDDLLILMASNMAEHQALSAQKDELWLAFSQWEQAFSKRYQRDMVLVCLPDVSVLPNVLRLRQDVAHLQKWLIHQKPYSV